MKIIKPHIKEIEFYVPESGYSLEREIEVVGRTCYKSEDKATPDSAEKFVRARRKTGHWSSAWPG